MNNSPSVELTWISRTKESKLDGQLFGEKRDCYLSPEGDLRRVRGWPGVTRTSANQRPVLWQLANQRPDTNNVTTDKTRFIYARGVRLWGDLWRLIDLESNIFSDHLCYLNSQWRAWVTNQKAVVKDQSEASIMMELTLLLSVMMVSLASAKVSLFLSSDQTKALYGIDTKDGLYYIREGVVNKYAMNFQHQVNMIWKNIVKF